MIELFPTISKTTYNISYIFYEDIKEFCEKTNINIYNEKNPENEDFWEILDSYKDYCNERIFEGTYGKKMEMITDGLIETGQVIIYEDLEECHRRLVEDGKIYDGDEWIDIYEDFQKESVEKFIKIINSLMVDSPNIDILILIEDEEIFL